MKLLCLSDLHGANRNLSAASRIFKEADAVFLTGDITNFGDDLHASQIIEKISKHTRRVFAIAGNCDPHPVRSFLRDSGVSVEQHIRLYEGIQFGGVGGSLPCPGRTPNEMTDAIFKNHLDQLAQQIDPSKPFVFLVHQPPKNTALDKTITGAHVGSLAVRNFIVSQNPIITCCGHIHENRGVDSLEGIPMVNPGAFKDGYYAWIVVENNAVAAIDMKSL